jgi:hypothetical protein
MHFVQEDGGNGEIAFFKELEMQSILKLHVRIYIHQIEMKDGGLQVGGVTVGG